jgi:phospholipase/carboxylesterase
MQNYTTYLTKEKLQEDPNAPIVYLIHGRAGNFDVMWTFRRCIPETFSIMAPQAQIPDPVGGFSWWQVQPILADRKTANDEATKLLNFFKEYEAKNNLKPKQRVAFGFSQGSAILSLILQQEPEFFTGVALLAGFVIEYGEADFQNKVLPRIFMAHGNEDQIVPIDKAYSSKERLEQWGFPVEFHEDAVGHKVGAPGMRALTNWMQSI